MERNSKERFSSLTIIPETCPLPAHRLHPLLFLTEGEQSPPDHLMRRYIHRNCTQDASQLEFLENNWKSCYTALEERRKREEKKEEGGARQPEGEEREKEREEGEGRSEERGARSKEGGKKEAGRST